MSDVSGPGVAAEGGSYLTGYPLQDVGLYALAKTWAAPEMPRPGCVWTHTIFIEFPDLATVKYPSRLVNLFVRPPGPTWSSYAAPAVLELDDSDELESQLSPQDENWLAAVMSALYRHPRERIASKREPSISVEALTLRIWDQQWPRLRRSFRFCTFTTKDRSFSEGPFDLQVIPGLDSSHRTRLPGAMVSFPVSDDRQPGWLTTLMEDVRQPNQTGLRDLLRRLGADTLGGRDAMPTLCDFHRFTMRSRSASSLHDAIAMLEKPSLLSTSDYARAQVAEYAMSRIEYSDTLAMDFFWDNWKYIEPLSLSRSMPQVAGALWRVSSRRLLTALRNGGGEDYGLASLVLHALTADEIIQDWPDGDVPLRELLDVREDLLIIPAFWGRVDIRSPSDLEGITFSFPVFGALLRGMVRDESMRAVVQLLGPELMLNVVQLISTEIDPRTGYLRWIQHCVKDVYVVAGFLRNESQPSVPLLLELAALVPPDAVPNHDGEDPWYTALTKVSKNNGSLPNALATYGFARALGWSTRNIAELLQLTFEQLHVAVSSSSLDEENWQLIEPRLPWVPKDKRMNRSGWLRKAVVDTFIDRRLWPRSFASLASSNQLFTALMEEAIERWGGRRFLMSVEESLMHDHEVMSQERRDLIQAFIASRVFL